MRYFAGARAAAGVPEETVEAGTLQELVEELAARHGDALRRVLTVATFLVDGGSFRDRAAALPAQSTVDVLPPFAGG